MYRERPAADRVNLADALETLIRTRKRSFDSLRRSPFVAELFAVLEENLDVRVGESE